MSCLALDGHAAGPGAQGGAMVPEDKLVTPFGTVTPDRVTCIVERGWLSEGSRRDVAPRRHPAAACTDTQLDVLVELVALFAELDWSIR